ncbi:transmembrane reductase CYB561D2 [Nomia melanderi]|uniref:transmembrane reductase CYB561D2 n=1 Tax=Nomia melanderi TaxID=2448451 RepID=UPI001304562F|nr:cytochrome b561 domain-containing protein 1-like [Nomia melanderi]
MVQESHNLRTIKIDDPTVVSSTTVSTESENTGNGASLYSKCVTAIDVVNHVLIVCLTVLTLYYSAVSTGVLDLHITLCTIGYILLMSEAIVVLAGESALTNFLSRRAKSHIHWILQVLGLGCILAGVVIMYRVKKVHFKSNHAILGLSSLVMMIVLTVCGYPVLVAAKLRKLIRPVILKFGHNLLGISCFVVGMASQCLGYKMRWLPNVSGIPNVQAISLVLTSAIIVLTVRSALPTLFRQFRSCFR